MDRNPRSRYAGMTGHDAPEYAQFIMYDKDRNGILAYIDMKNGEYFATLAWGIDDFTRSFSNLKDVIQGVVDMDRYYAKHCFG